MPIPVCPRCGQLAIQSTSSNGIRSRCDPCGLWARGNKPLRSAEEHRECFDLKRARHNAHVVLDRLWQTGLVNRDEAYELLARELGIDRDACHMGLMDVETARRVPAAAKAIRASLMAGAKDVSRDALSA